MKYINLTPSKHFLIRLERGEEVITEVLKFCQDNQIFSGSFSGIGACDEAELGSYSVTTKSYAKKTFTGEHEITSLTGIVSDKKIHVHANISDEECKVSGGHVNRMKISATCEIHLQSGSESLSRFPDDETGLELLNL